MDIKGVSMIHSATMSIRAAKLAKLSNPLPCRVLPFALFMLFVGLEELLRLADHARLLTLPDALLLYIYPLKVCSVAALLYRYMDRYSEFRLRDLLAWRTTAAVCLTGVATFVVWIAADYQVNLAGTTAGFDPGLLPKAARVPMAAVRVAGAVLVVPLMEEIFWRSFLLRYLIDRDFESVPVGAFSWGSFVVGSILFGLEHNLIVAGVLAGAVYSLVLYKTRSIAQCVLAHAVTNGALAGYVLFTGNWHFW